MGRPDPMREPEPGPADDYDPSAFPGPEPTRGRPGESGEYPVPPPSEGPSVPVREPAEVRGPFPEYSRPAGTSGKAVLSLALAILGLFFLPIILPVLAIIVGWAALSDIDRRPATAGRGLAIAGIVIGVIGLFIGVIGVIVAATYNWLVIYLY